MTATDRRRQQLSAYFFGSNQDESATADEIIDHVPDAVNTGLLDAAGRPILRRRPIVKFGFVP